jgi:phosphoribosylamine--glycine ligase
MRILIIGGGGREHCLAWKLTSSDPVSRIYAIPGNPGISEIGECLSIGIEKKDFNSIASYISEKKIDFVIVGPEAPLVDGIVDFLEDRKIKVFGPRREAAVIEGSKLFTKNLCKKYGIPNADSIEFKRVDYELALKYIENLSDEKYPIVLKIDGLAAGKGVIIPGNRRDAVCALDDIFIKNVFGSSGDSLIIEKYIDGFEVSILTLCDGENIVPMVLAQDYKKIFDGDRGKNTGGMGSYSPVPFVSQDLFQKILDDIIYPTYQALLSEKITYKGILYGGIIISDGQPYLLEYNCRFGDPETQAILPRLESDLLEVMLECVEGRLGNRKLKWDRSKCICVVLASKGYPESSSRGDIINGIEDLESWEDINLFHAGTAIENGKLVTNGGRVLGVVSKADDFNKTRSRLYEAISRISFTGMQDRRDIALKALINQ